jgi:Dual specificity phosphatase, catalytic domain
MKGLGDRFIIASRGRGATRHFNFPSIAPMSSSSSSTEGDPVPPDPSSETSPDSSDSSDSSDSNSELDSGRRKGGRRRGGEVDPKVAHDGKALETAQAEYFSMETPQRVFDFLFIGDQEDSRDWDRLSARGITAVVNMAWIENPFPRSEKLKKRRKTPPDRPRRDEGLEYLKLDILDHPTQDMSEVFQTTGRFIESHRKRGGTVLVHCHAGMSRAPSVCIAYCIRYLDMELSQAYQHVRRSRGYVCMFHHAALRSLFLTPISQVHHAERRLFATALEV